MNAVHMKVITLTKKSSVPENILLRVIEKSRKKTNKKIQEQREPKTLLEVFSEEADNEEDSNHGS